MYLMKMEGLEFLTSYEPRRCKGPAPVSGSSVRAMRFPACAQQRMADPGDPPPCLRTRDALFFAWLMLPAGRNGSRA